MNVIGVFSVRITIYPIEVATLHYQYATGRRHTYQTLLCRCVGDGCVVFVYSVWVLWVCLSSV